MGFVDQYSRNFIDPSAFKKGALSKIIGRRLEWREILKTLL